MIVSDGGKAALESKEIKIGGAKRPASSAGGKAAPKIEMFKF
jgi:hypothetical protein